MGEPGFKSQLTTTLRLFLNGPQCQAQEMLVSHTNLPFLWRVLNKQPLRNWSLRFRDHSANEVRNIPISLLLPPPINTSFAVISPHCIYTYKFNSFTKVQLTRHKPHIFKMCSMVSLTYTWSWYHLQNQVNDIPIILKNFFLVLSLPPTPSTPPNYTQPMADLLFVIVN